METDWHYRKKKKKQKEMRESKTELERNTGQHKYSYVFPMVKMLIREHFRNFLNNCAV